MHTLTNCTNIRMLNICLRMVCQNWNLLPTVLLAVCVLCWTEQTTLYDIIWSVFWKIEFLNVALSSCVNWSNVPNFVSARKPKKGMATAKQRLGKILKIHKMKFWIMLLDYFTGWNAAQWQQNGLLLPFGNITRGSADRHVKTARSCSVTRLGNYVKTFGREMFTFENA
jgi:hypothetical protein